jgi:hypothetical protein
MSKKSSKVAKSDQNNKSSNASTKAKKDVSDESPKVMTIIAELLLMIDGEPTPEIAKKKGNKRLLNHHIELLSYFSHRILTCSC